MRIWEILLCSCLTFSLGVGLGGCGGDNCSRGPKCSADPKPSADDIKLCQEQEKMQMSDPCRSAARSLGDCGYNNTVCTSDNKTDQSKSAEKFNASCMSQQSELMKCCTSNPSSAFCGGIGDPIDL